MLANFEILFRNRFKTIYFCFSGPEGKREVSRIGQSQLIPAVSSGLSFIFLKYIVKGSLYRRMRVNARPLLLISFFLVATFVFTAQSARHFENLVSITFENHLSFCSGPEGSVGNKRNRIL